MTAICFFLLVNILASVKSAKILGIFPGPGYSQFILAERMMTELVKRGHEVTVISPYKPKVNIKNYRTILVDGVKDVTAGDLYELEDKYLFENIIFLEQFSHVMTEYILTHKEVQQLIHSDESFDIVIAEQFVSEALMGFAPHFNAPLVAFSSLGFCEWNSHLVGNVRLPSVNPLSFSSYTDRMTFIQRLHNTLVNWFDAIIKELHHFPRQQEMLTKYFPRRMNLKDVMHNTSLLLLNSHSTTTHPSTLATSVVEIGGFHIEPKKLPSDIQNYLDSATEGAVFFSLGTNLRSADLPRDKLEGILKAFSKLKQRVLWKFEETNIPNIPKNVFVSKWLPQSDILAHPNLVAFITHGGLLSTTEAVHYGVPMIGIPIFGDQKMNVARSVQKQIALHIPFKDISENTLSTALNEVLNNPKYSKRAKEFSNVLKDQIAKPLDLAMFWIEYVLRHGGAPHFRNASLELYWYQLYLVDVIAFLIFCIGIVWFSINLCIKLTFSRNSNKSKSHKQKLN